MGKASRFGNMVFGRETIQALRQEITVLQKENGGKDQQIKTLTKENSGKDGEITALQKENARKDQEIQALQHENGGKDQQIKALKKDNSGKDREVEALQNENAEKDREVKALQNENAGKDREVEALQNENAGKDRKVEALQNENAGKDRKIQAQQNAIEEKDQELDDQEKELDTLQKEKDFEKEMSLIKALEKEAKEISCTIKSPPSEVKILHKEIVKKIKSTFSSNGRELVEGGNGPTLVTVVNANKAHKDIKRDMAAAKLTSSETSNVILLRIIPTEDQDETVEKQKSENFHLDLPFLVDQDLNFHDCSHNTKQFEVLMDHLQNENAGKDRKIQALQQENAGKDRKVEAMQNENAGKDRKVEALQNKNAGKDRKIEALKNENAEKERKIEESMIQTSTNKAKELSCTIKSPPSQVKILHKEIVEKIKSTFSSNGCELVEGGNGPTLVTVVNANKAHKDIKRDMAAAKLTSSETSNVILLRIIPTEDQDETVEKQKSENFHLDLPFLVDQDLNFHVCSHNTKQFEVLMDYLQK